MRVGRPTDTDLMRATQELFENETFFARFCEMEKKLGDSKRLLQWTNERVRKRAETIQRRRLFRTSKSLHHS